MILKLSVGKVENFEKRITCVGLCYLSLVENDGNEHHPNRFKGADIVTLVKNHAGGALIEPMPQLQLFVLLSFAQKGVLRLRTRCSCKV